MDAVCDWECDSSNDWDVSTSLVLDMIILEINYDSGYFLHGKIY